MDKDEFLAAWEEVCVEAAWRGIESMGLTPPGKIMLRDAYRAIGSKLMEGIEFYMTDLDDDHRTQVDTYRLTLPKEQ